MSLEFYSRHRVYFNLFGLRIKVWDKTHVELSHEDIKSTVPTS